MAKLLRDLVTRFVFKEDRTGIKRVQKSIDSIKSSLLGVAATLASTFVAGGFIQSTAKALEETQKLADSLGITVEQLQSLEYAAQQSGVSVDDLHSSLSSLQSITAQTIRGTGAYGAVLARFGITLHKSNGQIMSTVDLLHEINQRFQTLSRFDQINLAKSLGLSSDVVRLLRESPKHFNELIIKSKELGQYHKRNTKLAAEYEEKMKELKMALFDLGVVVVTAVLPIFLKMEEFFTLIIKKVIELAHRFPVLTSVMIKLVAIVGTLIASLVALSAIMKTLQVIVSVVIAALSGFSEIGVIILAVVAAITALVLVVQDLWVGLHGGRSVIIPMIKHFGEFIGKIKIVHAVLSGLRHAFHALVKDFKGFAHIFEKLLGIKDKATADTSLSTTSSVVHTHRLLSTAQPIGNISVAPPAQQTKYVTMNVGDINVNAGQVSNPNVIVDMINRSLDDRLRSSVDHFDSEFAR